MPVTLKSLKKKTGTVTLFGEEGDPDTLTIKYRLVTDETIDTILANDESLSSEERIRNAAEQVIQQVAAWDLQLDDDSPVIPLDRDVLCAQVPFDLMIMVLQAVRGERFNPLSVKPSKTQ